MANPQCSCEKCELRPLFFEGVSSSDVQSICNLKFEKEFKTGDIIIGQGEEIREFIYLKEGLVKQFRLGSNNREQIISIAKPFDFVSLLSVFSDTHYRYSVSALENSVTWNIDLGFIKNLMLKNGSLSMNVLEKMSRATDNIIINSLEIRQKQLYGRVGYILQMFADKIYSNNTFDLPISRKEIAEIIGMTTENVIRALSSFRQDKIIKINGKTIEIIDKARLLKIVDFS
jgi:CRP-like cAMP-binding protein